MSLLLEHPLVHGLRYGYSNLTNAFFKLYQTVQWVNRVSENCPNYGKGGSKSSPFVGFAYDTFNVTYKKRDDEQAPVGADCVGLNNYGLNSFATWIIPRNGYSIGISYNDSTVTITEYVGSNCPPPFARAAIRATNKCLQDGLENGNKYSRWFQFTPNEPPGYSAIGPPTAFTIKYYLPPSGTCNTLAKSLTIQNDQKCHQIGAGLYIRGYCGSLSKFSGCTSSSSSCANCTDFGLPQVQSCLSDFTGFGTDGGLFPSPITGIYVTCSAHSLSFTFAGLIALFVMLLL